jgi:integrase
VASIETLVLQDGMKRYRVWWRDPSGRVRAKRFPKYDAARSFLRDVEVDKARGSYVDPSKGRIIVADAWERFEVGPLRSYKESTQASHRFHFRTYVLPALGTRRINSIEKEDVERLIHDMEEKTRASGRKLKAGGYGSREKTLRALQRFLSEMVANGRIAKNPALGVKPGSHPAASIDGGGQALEIEQVTALIKATPEYWKPLVALLATSGLRISEALGLRRRDLDLASGIATVRQTVVEVEGKRILTTPKSRASRRSVKLIPSVVEMLKRLALPLDPNGFVFMQPKKSEPLARTWFNRRILKPASIRAGIRPLVSAHDLRHTAGAIASKSGMHPMAVKEMMGHSSIKVTYDVYGHLFPTMHEAGIAALEATFRAESGFGEATTAR